MMKGNKMSRIAELENLIANAYTQRAKANRLNCRLLARNINHDLRNWTEELATLKKVAA